MGMYLFRSLNQPPHLLSDMQLDVGFVCFGVFCLGSTLASLAIRIPGAGLSLDEESDVPHDVEGFNNSCGRSMPIIVLMFAALFLTLLTAGLVTPCMALRLDLE